MSCKLETAGDTGLHFISKISGSIFHEIKNVLSIINENAGLLEDLALMAERGIPIDPVRLKLMAEAVKRQIARADGIVKNMTRFAGSVSEPITTVDLDRTIEMVTVLTARFAAMQGVRVDLKLPEGPVRIPTAPFFLMNLVWLLLDFSMAASGDEKRIELAVEETETSVRLRFRGLAGLSEALLENFPSEREKILLAALAADLTAEPGCREIALRLKKSRQ
jgi:hypothetical protein